MGKTIIQGLVGLIMTPFLIIAMPFVLIWLLGYMVYETVFGEGDWL